MRRLRLVSLLFLPGLLAACGPQSAGTSTPTATLGTDSAATKVGGLPHSLQAGGGR